MLGKEVQSLRRRHLIAGGDHELSDASSVVFFIAVHIREKDVGVCELWSLDENLLQVLHCLGCRACFNKSFRQFESYAR